MLCDTTPMRWLHLPRQPKCWQQMPLTNVPLLPWLLEQHKAAGALMALECLPVPSKTALAPRTQLFVSEWQGLSRWHTAACWRLGWGCSRLSLSANQLHTLFNAHNGSSLGKHTKDPNSDMQAARNTQGSACWSSLECVPPPQTRHLAVPLSETLS